MTVKEDGSLGAWGGKKYEGLGSQNVIIIICSNLHPLGENRA